MSSNYAGSLIFDTRVDTNGFNGNIRGAANHVNGLTGAFKRLGKTIVAVLAVRQLVKFADQAIDLASDMNEVQNVVDTAFGSMAQKCEDFADTAIEKFGMSKLAAKQFASTYMAMGRGSGLDLDTASDMAIGSVGRIGDIASFYNKSLAEVDTMMKSIYTGETQSLKQIGVVMTEVNLQQFAYRQGINKTLSAMTQAEKIQLRYAYVMDQTNLAAGDFEKTADSWANQTRILSERWKELLGILGQGLIQVLAPVVKFLNTVVQKMIDFANVFSQITGQIFGKQDKTNIDTSGIDKATQSENNLADATDAATEANEKSLASFDELNTISENKSSDTEISTVPIKFDTDSVKTDEAEVETGITAFVEKLKELIKPFQEISFDNLAESLGRLKEAFAPFGSALGSGLEWIIKNVLAPLANWTISDVLPGFLNILAAGIEALNAQGISFEPLVKSLGRLKKAFLPFGKKIAAGLEWVLVNVLAPLATWTINKFIPAFLDLLAASFKYMCAVVDAFKPLFIWLWDNFFKPLAVWTGGMIIQVLGWLTEALLKVSNWISNNQKKFVAITIVVAAFFGAWRIVELMAFLQMSGKATAALEILKKGLITATVAKIKDLAVTAQLKLMYAGDFLKSIGAVIAAKARELTAWTVGIAAKIRDKAETLYLKALYMGDFIKSVAATITAKAQEVAVWSLATIRKIADKIATVASTAATVAYTVATKLATIAAKGFSIAMGALTSPIGLAAMGIAALVFGIMSLVKNWDKMSGAEKAISILGSLASAAIAAAIAVAIFHTTWSVGLAAAAIAGGLALIGLTHAFTSSARNTSNLGSSRSVDPSAFGGSNFRSSPLPKLASGAVIPPNAEFAAILGDQRHGQNLEAPEGLIRQIISEELSKFKGGGGNANVHLYVDGRELARVMAPYNSGETNRLGTRLINGVT